ncbi:hypothetical protein RJ639_004526 [Escallonia herrerae]|uniref:SelT-like protein n=1 Tax=Escallonia herrerae TaxID=1293975 RepID=A0AA88VYU5_9ASTE|nr:hypothetical protein RJ639_004526 [Escallonia herrerae]
MDRVQFLLLGLPIFLFFTDMVTLFGPSPPPPPPKPHHRPPHHHPHPHPAHQSQSEISHPLEFPTQRASGIGGIGVGNTVNIDFCASCSYRFFFLIDLCYWMSLDCVTIPTTLFIPSICVITCGFVNFARGTAVTMKNMLETQFPGINVVLANYPPPLPKRLLSKVVPVFQFGMIGLVMAGEHIFPRLGFAVPPPWYYTLRANRFGTISSSWLLGNFLQSFLQSSGAFEVHCNGEPVFSKLKEHRFPGEIELKDLIGKRIANSRVLDGLGGALWS